MTRMVLSDGQWALIEPPCLGEESGPGRTGGDTSVLMEAVLVRTGAPWRDLPEVFGKGNTLSLPWVKRDVFRRIFDAVSKDPDRQ